MKQNMLALRKKMNIKRPKFLRQDAKKISRARIPHKWRKPMGIHSKQRHGFASHYSVCVNTGFRGPVEVRGLDQSGLEQVLVTNPQQLKWLNKAQHGLIISGKVGTKKRIEIINIAVKDGFKILNIRDTQVFLKAKQDAMSAKKQQKELAKKQKEEAKEKSAQEKKKDTLAEKTKQEEKKELDKLLTKREA